MNWAGTKWGSWALFICAFADATFLPLPTPVLFLTLALLKTRKAYTYAIIGTAGIAAGAMVGYLIGHFVWLNGNGEFTGFAQFMLNHIPGFSQSGYNDIRLQFEKWNFWILVIASFMPLPFNIFSISAGAFDINIFMFCFATFLSQGIRFYLMALLVTKIGPEVKKMVESFNRPLAIIGIAGIAIAIIVFNVL